MASPVRLLHRVQVVLALLHLAIPVIQEVNTNTFPFQYLFPHWFMSRTLGASLCLGTFTILAKDIPVPAPSHSHFVLLLDTL